MKIENQKSETVNTEDAKRSSVFYNSIVLKLLTITVLMLLLLIPASMIQSIIKERENLNKSAIEEVSDKWAKEQSISGPILSLPIVYEKISDNKIITYTKTMKIFPKKLKVYGDIKSEKLQRGIYDVIVYRGDFDISGSFDFKDQIDTTNLKEVVYEDAFLTIGISDLRGIKENIKIKVDEQFLNVEPGSKVPETVKSGVISKIGNIAAKQKIDFSYNLKLNGSKRVEFIPIGGDTEVKIKSDWNSPSFSGRYLPDDREINEGGFTAEWKILKMNKDLPPSWISGNLCKKMTASTFGFDLIMPLDDYQKSMRSAKYAVLTIALTFLVFFLIEITNSRKIHAFQYALVGLAICLFYILLVSISEHSNFSIAYLLSSIGIIATIFLYSLSVFKKTKLSFLLLAILIALFGILFVILQMADFALLMGSISLLIILAITMYSTRNVEWYTESNK